MNRTIWDKLMLALALAAAAYLGVRWTPPVLYDPLPRGVVALVAYLLGVLLVAQLVRSASRRSIAAGRVMRVAAFAGALLLVGMAYSRAAVAADQHLPAWPPRLDVIRATDVDSIRSDFRVEYALRVAAHRLSDHPDAEGIPAIPSDWPYPDDVRLATRGDSNWLELWALTSDGVTACVLIRRHPATSIQGSGRSGCPKGAIAPPVAAFQSPRRDSETFAPVAAEYLGEPWEQYRQSGDREAAVDAGVNAAQPWHAAIDGVMRASVSVVGSTVLAGAHGTGTLAAYELATGKIRWQHRLPNWVHQDPVSDGRTVVVGFGDNQESFRAQAPSGVAAFELASGRRLWTGWDEGSVMTAPVIHDSTLMYGTGAGIVRKRSLRTGEVLAEEVLPGMVTMAPPAAVGDTIVFSLDHDWVCAFLISTFDRLWCTQIPNLRFVGHAAPALHEGHAIVSGNGTPLTMTFDDFASSDLGDQIDIVESLLFPPVRPERTGQVFASLRIRDGAVRWISPLYRDPREVDGHMSGTATFADGIGAIVLPSSDTLVAFDPATGRELWTAGAHDARGPVLIHEGHVILAGRDGVIESRLLSTGEVRCRMKMPSGYDRAGPVYASGLLIFTDLKGVIDALPEADVLECPVAKGIE